jgi:7-carboxy-7-deazaguanine synthase
MAQDVNIEAPKLVISEIFGGHGKKVGDKREKPTMQGEGKYTGLPSVFLRTGKCNMRCRGFSQSNPTDSTTWVNEFEGIDVKEYMTLESVPVVRTGCDTPYASDPKFNHLLEHLTPIQVVEKIKEWLFDGTFIHPVSKQDCHLVVTGGEPMLQQKALAAVMVQFEEENNVPLHLTIETNGTVPLHKNFQNWYSEFNHKSWYNRLKPLELFWSVSPKLFLSGEKWEKAIIPEIVGEYARISPEGQLKYVCDGSDRAWDEVERATELYRKKGVNFPVFIMPVGGMKETQEEHQAMISDQTIVRGYNLAARLQCLIYRNSVGR